MLSKLFFFPLCHRLLTKLKDVQLALEAPGNRLFGNNTLFVVGAAFSSTEGSAQ
jgi:hypothetical protein